MCGPRPPLVYKMGCAIMNANAAVAAGSCRPIFATVDRNSIQTSPRTVALEACVRLQAMPAVQIRSCQFNTFVTRMHPFAFCRIVDFELAETRIAMDAALTYF